MNITDALKRGKQQLSNSESSNIDTEVLLCYCLKCERSRLYSHPEQTLSDNEIKSFDRLITLRAEGHPVAHLMHEKEFWSLTLTISKDTLIPRPETECLVETVLTLIPKDIRKNVLDLGTGSGAIAIAIASERPDIKMTATDICDAALMIAKQNAQSNNIENIEFKKANWFNIEADAIYDLIVSNPPYIESNDPHLKQGDVRFEPLTALASGDDGLDDLRIIISEADKYLSKQGWLLVEHGYNQAKEVNKLFNENSFTSISTHKDYADNDRITFGQVK